MGKYTEELKKLRPDISDECWEIFDKFIGLNDILCEVIENVEKKGAT